MSPAQAALKATVIMPTDETAEAAAIVEKFLVASMVPDPETAARYVAEPLKLTFTGGRKFSHPRESTAFNAKRYKWVKKAMERSDVVPGMARRSSTTSERSTANGRTARRSRATAMSIASSFAAARSCRWMSGTTARSGC